MAELWLPPKKTTVFYNHNLYERFANFLKIGGFA